MNNRYGDVAGQMKNWKRLFTVNRVVSAFKVKQKMLSVFHYLSETI